jgi:ATP adenylyltransferase
MYRTWFTPWRMSYLLAPKADPMGDECVFCAIRDASDDRANFVLHRGASCFVVLNRFPYSNGHLLVIPFAHRDGLETLTSGERAELMALAAACEGALREAYAPQGINAGINLGTAAGAGVAGHVHMHLLPRWAGDTNFLSILGETRIVPEDLASTWTRLGPLLAQRLEAQRQREAS